MNEKTTPPKKEGNSGFNKTLTIIGIVLCVILIPMLIINCTLIIQSYVNEDKVPGIFGFMPFIVQSESMEPVIMTGDIIVVKEVAEAEKANLKVGDIITFYDPAGNGTLVVTHRIKAIEIKDGKTYYTTAGDYNIVKSNGNDQNRNGYDTKPVNSSKVIGKYTNVRIPFAGHIAMFMQTTGGLITCVVVPLVLLIGYELIRRRLGDKKKNKDVDALMAELEALKAQQTGNAATEAAEEAPAENVAETTENTEITETAEENTSDNN